MAEPFDYSALAQLAANKRNAASQKAPTITATPNNPMPTVSTPTSSGAYTTNVNTALKKKGVPSDQISYNASNNSYSVSGQPFMTAHKNYSGAGYTSPQNFNSAWNAYSQQQTAAQPSATYNPYTSSQSTQNPYNQQINNTISMLMNRANNPQAIDPYSTAEYAAAQAQADRSAGQNIRAAQEAYGSAGFGRSYGLGERAQGIKNGATEYLMTQVAPSIIAAKQAEQQQQFNNSISALNQLLGQQTRADQQVQQDINNNYNVAQLTGNYMPPGAQQVISQLLGLKQQAETRGITADQRAGLSQQADALRSQLATMGIDPAQFGANVSAATAGQSLGNLGVRTMAGQQQDLANREFNVNAALQYGDRTGQVLSPQQDINGLFRQLQTGITSAGTPLQQSLQGQQVASGLITEQQQRDLATREAAMQEWQTTGYATPSVSSILGVPQGTPTNDAAYRDAAMQLDADKFTYAQMQDVAAIQNQQGQPNSGLNLTSATDLISTSLAPYIQATKNSDATDSEIATANQQLAAAKEQIFVDMFNNYGLTGNDMLNALSRSGYTTAEINSLKNEYPSVFQ